MRKDPCLVHRSSVTSAATTGSLETATKRECGADSLCPNPRLPPQLWAVSAWANMPLMPHGIGKAASALWPVSQETCRCEHRLKASCGGRDPCGKPLWRLRFCKRGAGAGGMVSFTYLLPESRHAYVRLRPAACGL